MTAIDHVEAVMMESQADRDRRRFEAEAAALAAAGTRQGGAVTPVVVVQPELVPAPNLWDPQEWIYPTPATRPDPVAGMPPGQRVVVADAFVAVPVPLAGVSAVPVTPPPSALLVHRVAGDEHIRRVGSAGRAPWAPASQRTSAGGRPARQRLGPRGGPMGPWATARDREITLWLCRHRYATTNLLLRKFGAGDKPGPGSAHALRRVLRRLGPDGLGWVAKIDTGAREFLWVPTPLGYAEAGCSLPAASAGEFRRHTLTLVAVAIGYEAALWPVVTEREIVHGDKSLIEDAQTPQFAVGIDVNNAPAVDTAVTTARRGRRFTKTASWRRHYPDMVVVTPAGTIAVEVELTAKTTSMYRAILGGFAQSVRGGRYAAVVYRTTSPALDRTLARVGVEVGLVIGQTLIIEPLTDW